MNQPSEGHRPPKDAFQAVVVVDRDGVIVYWSEAAEALTGHAQQTLVGRSLDVIVPEEYRDRHWTGFRAAMATGVSRFEGLGANIPVLHADGQVRRWPGRFSVLRDARGMPAGAAAVWTSPSDGDPTFFDL